MASFQSTQPHGEREPTIVMSFCVCDAQITQAYSKIGLFRDLAIAITISLDSYWTSPEVIYIYIYVVENPLLC